MLFSDVLITALCCAERIDMSPAVAYIYGRRFESFNSPLKLIKNSTIVASALMSKLREYPDET